MTTIEQFHEKLLETFKTANHNIINRIGSVILDDKLIVKIRRKKEGMCDCINASTLIIKPSKEKHKMEIEEIWVGYDSECSRWSDHMGGHIIDCTGKNVDEAINLIVTKMNERVED